MYTSFTTYILVKIVQSEVYLLSVTTANNEIFHINLHKQTKNEYIYIWFTYIDQARVVWSYTLTV